MAAKKETGPEDKSEDKSEDNTALKKELFAKYDKAEEKVIQAKKAVEAATAARSTVVQEITEKLNRTAFNRKGKILKVMKRLNKTTGEMTYFFRGGNEEVEDVDD